jgi:hypothetical protein
MPARSVGGAASAPRLRRGKIALQATESRKYVRVVTTLPCTREALAQARGLLDRLPALEDSVQDYRDQIGWVLDRGDNVWRVIEEESRGQRTHDFGTWWASQLTSARQAIKDLRNAEVKRGEQRTRISRANSSDRIRIHEDGRITLIREDGTEVAPGPDACTPSRRCMRRGGTSRACGSSRAGRCKKRWSRSTRNWRMTSCRRPSDC